MLYEESLSDDFFKLRTGAAGGMLQKFVNYHVRTAVVLANQGLIRGRFKELVAEASKSGHFRVFQNREEAERWLLSR